jgi:outer membrane lipoprotein SlyB
MNTKALPFALAAALTLAGGCADTGSRYGSSTMGGDSSYDPYDRYGRYDRPASGEVRQPVSHTGRIVDIDTIEMQPGYRFGVGSVIGAVAGGLLGSQIGEGSGSTAAAIAGAAIGGAAGTAAESQMNRRLASRVTVDLRGGGTVTIVQPPDPELRPGMRVAIIGTGESARVVPAG